MGNVTVSFFFACAVETCSTIKALFMFYFVSDPESESEPESESIRSPESESEPESEQPHHDSAPLVSRLLLCTGLKQNTTQKP